MTFRAHLAALSALVVLSALGGCSAGDPSGEDAAKSPAVDVVPAAPPPTPAAPPPPAGPAPGNWRFTLSVQGVSDARRVTIPPREDCLRDGMSLQEAQMIQAEAGVSCSDYAFRREGASMIGSYACTLPDGAKTTSEVTTTGDMTRAFTSTLVNTYSDPAPGLPASVTLIVVAERLGDCSAPPPPTMLPIPDLQ